MRLAYADPPYLGCARRYAEHPDAAVWDDPAAHATLMADLDAAYDGWALSLSSGSLRTLLPLAPEGVRVAVWVKPFAAYKKHVRVAYTWEPVIFCPASPASMDAHFTRDHLSAPMTTRRGTVGAKPEVFCRWILALLGWLPDDEVTDVFPGSGVLGTVLAQGALL